MRTEAGLDWQAKVMGDTASNATGAYAAANYMGVTANSGTPLAADTTLAGEITTGTLGRAQAAYAHTNGQNSYTLTKTFTSDQVVTLAKTGIFNASTAGTMVFEGLMDAVAVLRAADQVAITVTVVI